MTREEGMADEYSNPGDQGDVFPRPDPTVLTTEALRRDIGALERLLKQEIRGHVDLCKTKFNDIEEQFNRLEQLRREQKQDTKEAVDAALSSQREAVAKTEVSTTEQIHSLSQKSESERESLRREIGDVKERITIIEGQKVGAREDRSGLYATIGIGVTVLLAVIAIVGFIAARGT